MEESNYSILLNLIIKENEDIKSDEDNERSTVLFFKIWRNKYLRNYIFETIKYYLANRGWRTITLEGLNKNRFRDYFSKIILRNVLPVKSSFFPEIIEVEKKPKELPKYSIKYLKLTSRLKECVLAVRPGFIPSSVTCLELDHHYNLPLCKGIIPNSVTNLTLGNGFNQSIEIDDFPSSIKYLTFGSSFNKPLKKGSIPNGVLSITFGSLFDQDIDSDVIPSSCIELTFGQNFNRNFKIGSIPNSVKTLKLSIHYKRVIEPNVLPHSITNLNIGSSFYANKIRKIEKNTIPTSCVELRYRGSQYFSIDPSTIPPNIDLLKYDIFN
ncbi:hypothetical protein DDB_G0285109 [Dictyostelium discoideum AX4]|uniref:FNIP repeat-containing protein n=1 Tax=Dictyostelium discoideum TaxID=44689 RepID=Q54NP7_DICDI|nr:hypothetical protein DDB_G0285109 [Dictyostelium discoideum AX4]EAL64867.1 hypothetical protein DDB_G0285109 [Dictyostelium discoideum AX4]|eukprot:XP_639869.1 hypothetical protein DDB_G0285109 [Dictyostelium discoideum AX4]